jgi:hypothetical protein
MNLLDQIKKRDVIGLDFFSFSSKSRHEKVVEYYYNHLHFLEKGMQKLGSEPFFGFGSLLQKPDIVSTDYHNRLCIIEILIDTYDANLRTGRKSLEDDETALKEIVNNMNKVTERRTEMPKYRLFTLSITQNRNILREFKSLDMPKIKKSEGEIIEFIKRVWEKYGSYYVKHDKKFQGICERIMFTDVRGKNIDFLRMIKVAMANLKWNTGIKSLKDSGIWTKKSGTKILYYNIEGEEFFDKIRPLVSEREMKNLKEAINWRIISDKKKKERIRYFDSILKVGERLSI